LDPGDDPRDHPDARPDRRRHRAERPPGAGDRQPRLRAEGRPGERRRARPRAGRPRRPLEALLSEVLRVESLSKSFAGAKVVEDLSFAVEGGSTVGLVGPNGAGKTTAFNLITGFLPADQGRVALHGADITGRAPHKIVRAGMARTFQNLRLFDGLSV